MSTERPTYEVQQESRPTYSAIIHGVVDHETLTGDQRIDVQAIDKMISTLKEDKVFEKSFEQNNGLTLGDKGRLTDKTDPNYSKDVLWGVHNPEEFVVAVLVNSPQLFDEQTSQWVDDEKRIQDWGRRMMRVATENPNDSDVESKLAKRRIGIVVMKEGEHFDIEFSAPQEEPQTVTS